MRILDNDLLAQLSAQAGKAPRLRQNYNLHASPEEPCQRLLIAIEPGSYVRPHRHLRDPKPECLLGMSGRLALVLFDDSGTIEQLVPFGPGEGVAGVDIPAGVWHSVVALESGSVLFEAKQGPYRPVEEEDFAPWAPQEGSCAAGDYLRELTARVVAAIGE